MSLLLQLAMTFGLISVLSIGGANATIPEIQRQVVTVHHWMSDATFASLVALAQAAPGPNVLIISIIGWQLAGIAGLLTASAAIVLPSSVLSLGIGRYADAHQASTTFAVARRALAPIALGLMFASGIIMTQAAFAGVLTLVVVVGVAALVFFTRLSPIWGIAAGAVLGVVGHRLHIFG